MVRIFLRTIACFLLWLSSVAGAAQFVFGALGDTPYNEEEESRFIGVMAELNHGPLAFVVHVGDFKNGHSDCSDEVYLQRRQWFELSHHPFIYVPGDNDWTDCSRFLSGGRDPIERLQKLRQLFFAQHTSLGQRTLELARQSDPGLSAPRPYPEHARWVYGRVLFATLNVPGGDNNRRMPEERRVRSMAVHEWVAQAFLLARQQSLRGVVLMMQADPWTGMGKPRRSYADLLNDIAANTLQFDGEVVLIHGDSHRFRFDRPLKDPRTGKRIANFTRIEVFGSPDVNWVRVTVRDEDGKLKITAAPGS